MKPIKIIKFEQKGTFKALYAAEKWINENNYSMGSTCVCSPCAVFKGKCYVAKWRNLSQKERNSVDGLLDGDFRKGPLLLKLYR